MSWFISGIFKVAAAVTFIAICFAFPWLGAIVLALVCLAVLAG